MTANVKMTYGNGAPPRGGAATAAKGERTHPRVPDLGPGLDFIERFGDDAGEALFMASLAMLEQAAVRAREGTWGRWSHFPRGEVRRLRRDVGRAMRLAHQALLLQEEVNESLHRLTNGVELDADLRDAAVRATKPRRVK